MDMQPVSALKATTPAMLRALKTRRRPILVVSNGVPRAVLQDVASYERTQDAIALLKMMLQSEQSVAARRGSSTKDVVARLRARAEAPTSGARARAVIWTPEAEGRCPAQSSISSTMTSACC